MPAFNSSPRFATLGSEHFNASVPAIQVYVDTTLTGPVVPANPIGLNIPFYDGTIMNSSTQALLAATGIKRVRWPGGAVADHFHWRGDNSSGNSSHPYLSAGYTDYVNPLYTMNAFCSTVLPALNNAKPVFTVNYGSGVGSSPVGGDPTEAGALAARAVTNGYAGAFYEIGDEQYAGDGSQGSGQCTNLWTDKSPSGYVTNAASFITDIKASDATAKIIVPYCSTGGTMSTAWPYQQTWNYTVLSGLAASIDALGISHYPQSNNGENDANLLGFGLSQIPTIAASIANEIAAWGGGHTPGIVIMESGGVSTPPIGRQSISDVGKVFCFESLLMWLEQGALWALWFAAHTTIYTTGNNSASLYNYEGRNYGDYGILSSGLSGSGQTEPPTDTPFPPYYGLALTQYIASGGETLLKPTSLSSLVGVHASLAVSGKLNVAVTNRSATWRTVAINLLNYTTTGGGTIRTHKPGDTAITIAAAGIAPSATSITVLLAPYAIAALTL